MDDERLTIEEAAHLLNIDVETIERWLERGLPAEREASGAVRVRRADLDAFLAAEDQGTPRDPTTA